MQKPEKIRSRSEIRRLAPAKLNLILEVIARRDDGYHEIDSLFVPIDLCDEIRVGRTPEPVGEITIGCDDASVPVDSRNTVWRAIEAFYRGRRRPAIRVEIRKRIPAGAGLGGGSSDAAAVLLALARLEGVSERPDDLRSPALAVGADVPFFLWCRPARVRGIGERVEPLPPLPERFFAVVWPGFPVSTRVAYQELDRSLTSPKTADTMRRFLSGERGLGDIHNDFEAIVGRSHPRILHWKKRLLSLGAEAAGLSGSGSAVFGLFRDAAGAGHAADAVRAEGQWAMSAGMWRGSD